MSTLLKRKIAFALSAAAVPVAPADAQEADVQPHAEISFVELDKDITLRRMVVRNERPKGTVILLHGFPETLYAWQGMALTLGKDAEVHAFDWPGFGQSSRPDNDRFSYAPRDYARVLGDYINKAGIDTSKLTIYATDIGALPALLLALEKPDIARTIIVGDFAPFDRPEYMQERLQLLKLEASAEAVRTQLNANRDEILENAFRRGLPDDAQFEISSDYKADMALGWGHGAMSSADAFYHYYSHFTRDQQYFEANVARLKTPMKIVWGAEDFYIAKEMGIAFARKTDAPLTLLPGIGHYPHLQAPEQAIGEIRASLP